LATKSEFSSSTITIDIHLLDPDVDRSMAEFEECRLECSCILIGEQAAAHCLQKRKIPAAQKRRGSSQVGPALGFRDRTMEAD
jgi:hypothetical protein